MKAKANKLEGLIWKFKGQEQFFNGKRKEREKKVIGDSLDLK